MAIILSPAVTVVEDGHVARTSAIQAANPGKSCQQQDLWDPSSVETAPAYFLATIDALPGPDDIVLSSATIDEVRAKVGLPALPFGERRTDPRRWVREIIDHYKPGLRGKALRHRELGVITADGRGVS